MEYVSDSLSLRAAIVFAVLLGAGMIAAVFLPGKFRPLIFLTLFIALPLIVYGGRMQTRFRITDAGMAIDQEPKASIGLLVSGSLHAVVPWTDIIHVERQTAGGSMRGPTQEENKTEDFYFTTENDGKFVISCYHREPERSRFEAFVAEVMRRVPPSVAAQISE